MDKLLRPDCLDLSPSDPNCESTWRHWRAKFENYVKAVSPAAVGEAPPVQIADNLQIAALTNLVSTDIYKRIKDCTTLETAMKTLENIFVKVKHQTYQRYCLAMSKQKPGENIEQYIHALEILANECTFKQRSDAEDREICLIDAFVRGVAANEIRQRLLEPTVGKEGEEKSWKDFCDTAKSLELSYKSSAMMSGNTPGVVAALENLDIGYDEESDNVCAAMGRRPVGREIERSKFRPCPYCGRGPHGRDRCPAKEEKCGFCDKVGHYARVCMMKKNGRSRARFNGNSSDGTAAMTHPSLSDSIVNVKVNSKYLLSALIDTGSSYTFIDSSFVDKLNLVVSSSNKQITMASQNYKCRVLGAVQIDRLEINGVSYTDVQALVMESLCCDLLVGHDLLGSNEKLIMYFGGPKKPLVVDSTADSGFACVLAPARITSSPLFKFMPADAVPIACKSRKFSQQDEVFIKGEVASMLENGMIEPTVSPWRAQVLVTGGDRQKRRMVIDYSRTVNKYNLLDAYPLPNLDAMARKVAQFRFYSTFDLKSAYNQIPICEKDRIFTAFEANGRLYQATRIPQGVNNGPPAFQRTMDSIVEAEELPATFPYLDNVTVCGNTKETLEGNVSEFMKAVGKYGLILNHDKTISSVTEINMLGFLISYGQIRPDPERMQPLRDLPVPIDADSLKRAMGLFSYYSQWVPRFSDQVRLLAGNPDFPLGDEAVVSFEGVKKCIADACIAIPTDGDMLIVETDASGYALSASLNQSGRPVAFFSRKLKTNEMHHSAIEKEACALVEATRKWRHYLMGRKFLAITDQQAVSYIFSKNRGKDEAKNGKIMRWRLELSCLDFDIRYRPGKHNHVADCLSRDIAGSVCAVPSHNPLAELHNSLCHPGQVRLLHYVRSANLPYSAEQVKQVCETCRTCAIEKPNYFRPKNPPLVRATKPMERLSMDFKGPVPSTTANKYLFVVIDEYSRFPFVFPCSDMTAPTVIKCLETLFSFCGEAHSVHCDRGPCFVCAMLKDWLLREGIASGHSAAYNPRGNGQVERYNGVIWKAVCLALRSRGLEKKHWEQVLPDVLHSLRTLVCTATNEVPHDRFFAFPRRHTVARPLPRWLTERSKALIKRHVKMSKYEDSVEEAEIIDVNPTYARVRVVRTGHEKTVSLRDLAPLPSQESETLPEPNISESAVTKPDRPPPATSELSPTSHPTPTMSGTPSPSEGDATSTPIPVAVETPTCSQPPSDKSAPRRSNRTAKPPDRLNYGELGGPGG